jgi:hypothetical protein
VSTPADYAAARANLLERLVAAAQADDRFVAAWLTGSFGRGEADNLSDLDLTFVVVDAQRDALCARPWMVGAGTNARRLAFFQQFGDPAVIHENHHNAPEGGSFSYVLYAGSALMVDFVFVPLSNARRPAQSKLLYAKSAIPFEPPPPRDTVPSRSAAASERVSFFWMMAAVTAKYRARGDAVYFHLLLDDLYAVEAEIARLVAGEPARTGRGSRAPLAQTPGAQADALRAACQRVLAHMPIVEAMGGHIPPAPMETIETLLNLGNDHAGA